MLFLSCVFATGLFIHDSSMSCPPGTNLCVHAPPCCATRCQHPAGRAAGHSERAGIKYHRVVLKLEVLCLLVYAVNGQPVGCWYGQLISPEGNFHQWLAVSGRKESGKVDKSVADIGLLSNPIFKANVLHTKCSVEQLVSSVQYCFSYFYLERLVLHSSQDPERQKGCYIRKLISGERASLITQPICVAKCFYLC